MKYQVRFDGRIVAVPKCDLVETVKHYNSTDVELEIWQKIKKNAFRRISVSPVGQTEMITFVKGEK